jgi:hypothetical protein
MNTLAAPWTQSHNRERLRAAWEFLVVGICGVALAFTGLFVCVTLITGQTAGTRDGVVYWATGQQLAHHGNPYDAEALLNIESRAGLHAKQGAMYMRNPPWTLPITLPLGLMGLRAASLLWSLLLLFCLGLSVHLLWLIHGRPQSRLHLLAFTFAPAILCLMFGQTSLFALLGLVLFLRLHQTRPFLAGMSLWLCALKPHLFLPFGVVLLAWIVVTKSYKILAGAALAIAASCAIVYLIDPMAWIQYSQMMRASGVVREFIPCLNVVLRLWIPPHAVWIEYLPTGLGCVWAFGYYFSRRNEWSWTNHGSLLMLVSFLVAPYCWLFDQALAIPALLRGAYNTRSRNLLAILALCSAFIEIALLCNIWFPFALFTWTLWTAPAWLIWYLMACRSAR